ncbi:winged helix-turn-helix domain-containing protein [Nitrospira sp. NS4]|uniref:winged helix-turn-helix domain-containing protein n=1 Tax=Nitrospira sp. NS4 TaxID=3414498 RepID=UPI003C2B77FD
MLWCKPEWRTLLRPAKTTDRVVPSEEVRTILWGNDSWRHDRDLDQIITSLNLKPAPQPGSPKHIAQVPGTGYRLIRKKQALPLST